MTRMSTEFADTNVVLYLLDDGPKADRAEIILGQGPRISVQVFWCIGSAHLPSRVRGVFTDFGV